MVEKAECASDSDCAIQHGTHWPGPSLRSKRRGGEVVAFMGDARLWDSSRWRQCGTSLFRNRKRHRDRLCEWISNCQAERKGGAGNTRSLRAIAKNLRRVWPHGRFHHGQPPLKLGEHRLLIGNPINYAASNRQRRQRKRESLHHRAPSAAKREFGNYSLAWPGGGSRQDRERSQYECYFLDLADIWIEGVPEKPAAKPSGDNFCAISGLKFNKKPTGMIEQVEAEIFQDFQTRGYSRPARLTCRCANGQQIEVFIKFAGGVRDRYLGLCAEMLCSGIARHLGFLTPDPYIVNLSPLLGRRAQRGQRPDFGVASA